jgi:cytoskeletal protein CcmA (bactofilin family)
MAWGTAMVVGTVRTWPSNEAPLPSEVAAGEMVVGSGVRLKAVLSRCARILVRGQLEADDVDCEFLTIERGGDFKGSVTAMKAEIQGRFEGRLTAAVLLVQRPARIDGHVEYNDLQIESGAAVSGTIRART